MVNFYYVSRRLDFHQYFDLVKILEIRPNYKNKKNNNANNR